MHRRPAQHRRWWAAAAAAAALLLVPATTAQAALPSAGSWTSQTGPRSATGVSAGIVSWDAAARTVTVRVDGYGLPAGRCQTTYFDWTSPASHHDLRGVRTCQNNTTRINRWVETVPVTGVHKMRVCTGANDVMGTCSIHPDASKSLLADWSGTRGRTCASWVLVSATGAVSTNSGGDPRRCDA